jgi:hypothetical protein
MTRAHVSRILSISAASAGVLLLAACGAGGTMTGAAGSAQAPAGTEAPSAQPTTTTTVQAPAGGSGQPEVAAEAAKRTDGLCKAGDVKLSLGDGDAGAGSVFRPLLITNVSSRRCTIQGFPGVSYVAGEDGHQVGKAAFRAGTKGSAVKLNKGQTAAADLKFVNVQNFDPAVCKPTDVTGLRIYLPQETAAKFLPAPGTGCASSAIPGDQLEVQTAHRA